MMMNNMMFNFNQMGMNNPMMGMNNQQNQMNGMMMMDETAQNIKNIIQPYENRIRELEEIIKQKDFEIIVLKQKLTNNMPNINNMNPMMMNMNMNPGNMNQQMENKGKEITLTIISENKREYINCFGDDKASILYEKYKGEGALTFNYKILNQYLTIKENGIYNDSFISVKKNKNFMNLTFEVNQRMIFLICLSEDCPIDIAFIYFFMRIGRIIDRDNKNYVFFYKDNKMEIEDKTPIRDIFHGFPNPIVRVRILN